MNIKFLTLMFVALVINPIMANDCIPSQPMRHEIVLYRAAHSSASLPDDLVEAMAHAVNGKNSRAELLKGVVCLSQSIGKLSQAIAKNIKYPVDKYRQLLHLLTTSTAYFKALAKTKEEACADCYYSANGISEEELGSFTEEFFAAIRNALTKVVDKKQLPEGFISGLRQASVHFEKVLQISNADMDIKWGNQLNSLRANFHALFQLPNPEEQLSAGLKVFTCNLVRSIEEYEHFPLAWAQAVDAYFSLMQAINRADDLELLSPEAKAFWETNQDSYIYKPLIAALDSMIAVLKETKQAPDNNNLS